MSSRLKFLRDAVVIAAISILLMEVLLRAPIPKLQNFFSHDTALSSCTKAFASPSLLGGEEKYRPAPYTQLCVEETGLPERLNSEGFRGPDYSLTRKPNSLRILAIGDSVVQGFSTSFEDTWEQRLESRLRASGKYDQVEVINAGVGGYTSWQALARLKARGGKYKPDLILAHIATNDMLYGSLPEWRPGLVLSDVEKAFLTKKTEEDKSRPLTPFATLRKHSYSVKLALGVRAYFFNRRNQERIINEQLETNPRPFNTRALTTYEETLEELYSEAKRLNAKLGLVVTAYSLTEFTLARNELDPLLLVIYTNFPLSKLQLWEGIERYRKVQRAFLQRHPDVIPIDMARAFDAYPQARERVKYFTDHIHLNPAGNQIFAETVYTSIKPALFDR